MKKIIKSALCFLLILQLFASGCSWSGQKEESIKIGAILPLSGKSVQYGQQSKEGINIALEEINAEGGINGRKLQVVYEDSLDDPKTGISAYRKLKDIDKIKIYLSTLSNISLAIGPLAQEDKNIFFVIGTGSPSIAKIGDFVFRNNIDTAGEADKIAEVAFKDLGYKKIAILATNSDGGQIYSQKFKEKFESLGGKIVFNELYESNSSDHRTSLAKIGLLSPDAIYIIDRINGLAQILEQITELNINIKVLSTFGAESNELLEMAEKSMEGIVFTSSVYDPESSETLVSNFNKKSEEKYGHKAEYFSAIGYDNLKILAESMRKCHDPEDATCVRDGLFSINYNGITGETTFDNIGEARKPIVIKTVKNGQFVPYEK